MDDKESILSDFVMHLRTTTNKRGRPFQRRTVNAYRSSVVALAKWLDSPTGGAGGDFLACDAATLNRFFRWYYVTHDVPKSHDGQGGYTGGTNTQQRNLAPFFQWLEDEYEHPSPWRDKTFQRYATPALGKPKTLTSDFVGDVLKVTGGGSPRVKDFETLRDFAILCVLTDGLRAEELLTLTLDSLHLAEGIVYVIPLKGQRNSTDLRPVPLQPRTVVALRRYLRARALHKAAASPHLWLGVRGQASIAYMALYRMVKRRAEQAGYNPAEVTPHSFCHTWCDSLLSSGVSGENVMAVRGWTSHRMLLRYGADQASNRAVAAVQKLGDRY
ncbi:tyrosine-type recombinase/integrase [Streptacidiphilus sp. N1-12]|uniref:Tyrosine-type recombinase/integrase n=2 Tax=Streptacidiphilus alkalitolerans TaxID=3342712 RepID=A0ABV6VI50_9ACTN